MLNNSHTSWTVTSSVVEKQVFIIFFSPQAKPEVTQPVELKTINPEGV
jgi:hypothetical protein